MKKRRICVVLVDRANYGRMWPVMKEIRNHPGLELQTVCAGTMLLERFGQAENVVREDGFEIHGRVYMELEGSVPTTMAKSVGFGIIEFANEFNRLQPDIVLIIGDRYEALSAVIAAAYQNIPIAHIQGGEVSGSIDESARHSITKFAQFHFPSTRRSADFLVRMGENPDTVFNYGCPCGDYITTLDARIPVEALNKVGVGAPLSKERPFLLVVFHPVTTRFGKESSEVEELLMGLEDVAYPTLWLWPNIDAGSDRISKVLRRYREQNRDGWLRLVKNFDPMSFQRILKASACAVGNSSSFIRDSTFSGTPVVLVGNRQEGREFGENLVECVPEHKAISQAVQAQVKRGRYAPSTLYGNGTASVRIAAKLAEVDLYTQKRLHFIHD